jgi:hypothetical protein
MPLLYVPMLIAANKKMYQDSDGLLSGPMGGYDISALPYML